MLEKIWLPIIALVFLVLILGAVFASSAGAKGLKEGDAAPAFSLTGSDGNTYTLEGLLAAGKPGIVLAWFPKAFTPG